jgi:hypothetical protein
MMNDLFERYGLGDENVSAISPISGRLFEKS